MSRLLHFLKNQTTLLYILFFIFVFFISLYLTFPRDRLKPILESKLEKAIGMPLTFDEVDTHYVTGFALRKLSIFGEKGEEEPLVTVDKLTLFLNPFSLVFGSYSGYFALNLLGGKTTGSFSISDNEGNVNINFSTINLRQLGILTQKNYVINGNISGSISGILALNELTKSRGKLEMNAKKLTIEKLSISTPLGPFVFPELAFSTFVSDVSLKDENVSLNKIEFVGPNAKIYIRDGIIKLAKTFADMKINLTLEFGLDDELKNRFGIIVDQFCSFSSSSNLYSLKLSGPLLSPMATK